VAAAPLLWAGGCMPSFARWEGAVAKLPSKSSASKLRLPRHTMCTITARSLRLWVCIASHIERKQTISAQRSPSSDLHAVRTLLAPCTTNGRAVQQRQAQSHSRELYGAAVTGALLLGRTREGSGGALLYCCTAAVHPQPSSLPPHHPNMRAVAAHMAA